MQGPSELQENSMAPQQLDPSSKYDVKQQIGKGSFGSAFLVTNKHDKKDYVLKRVRLAKQTKWQRSFTLQERDLVTTLQHPFIVPCVETWILQGHTVNMVYGYCEKGDLASYLQRVQKLRSQVDEGQMVKWLCQLLLALDYLQTKKVLHRDIKTSNLMLTCDMDVQIGDFGLATRMQDMGAGSKPEDTNLVGTPHYMSPELLSCKEYGFKTDVWSLGCVFYELTAQRPTFNAFNIHGLVSKIKKNKLAPLPDSYSKEWRDVIELMLLKNPDKRPSVQQLMALPCLRPGILEARQRAQQLMPDVLLPPLLDPTPFEVRQSISAAQEQDDDSESPATALAARFSDALDAMPAREDEQLARTDSAVGATAVQPVGECEILQLWSSNSLNKYSDLQLIELAEKAANPSFECQVIQQQQDQGQYCMQVDVLDTQPADTISSRCSNDSYAGSSSPSSSKHRARAKADSNDLDSTGRRAVAQPGIRLTRAERVAAAIAAARGTSPAMATSADQAAAQTAQQLADNEEPSGGQDGHSSRDNNPRSKDSTSSSSTTQAVTARQQAAASLSARLASYKEKKRAAAVDGRMTSKPPSARGISRSSPRPAWNAGAGVSSQSPAPATVSRQRSHGGRSSGGASTVKAAAVAAAAVVTSALTCKPTGAAGEEKSSKHGLPKRVPSAGSPYLQALQDHQQERQKHIKISGGQELMAADSVHQLLSKSQQLTQKVGQLQQGLQQQQQPSHPAEPKPCKQQQQQPVTAEVAAFMDSSGSESDDCTSAIKRLHFDSASPSLGDHATVSVHTAGTPDIYAAATGALCKAQPQNQHNTQCNVAAAQESPVFWANAAASSRPSDSDMPELTLPLQSMQSGSQSRRISITDGYETSSSTGNNQPVREASAPGDEQARAADDGSMSSSKSASHLSNTQQQRLELLETVVSLVGSLYARRRWHELGSILGSAGVLPDDVGSAVHQAQLQGPASTPQEPHSSTSNGCQKAQASFQDSKEQQGRQQQQSLKLGDTVVLGRRQKVKGQIRYIGPVAWDETAEDWVGMELEAPCGMNATQKGITYFDCPPKSATFHRASQLTAYKAGE